MKKIILVLVVALVPCLGLANEGITKEEMINKVIETGNEEFDFNSYFEGVDVNDDGIISKNELEMLKDGTIELDKALEEVYGAKSLRTEEEIIEKTNLFFKNADQNSNGELDLAESEAFFKNYVEYEVINQVTNSFNKQDRSQDGILNEKDMITEEEMLLKLETMKEQFASLSESVIKENIDQTFSFNKQDRNQDGILNEKDVPTRDELILEEKAIEEKFASLEKSLASLDDNFDEENIEQSYREMSEKMRTLRYDEEYSQADKNKDECLDKEEFVNLRAYEDKKYRDEYIIGKDENNEYRKDFDGINTNGDNCVDKDEYLAEKKKFQEITCKKDPIFCEDDDELKEYSDEEFNKTDENKDGCVVVEEYVNYEKKKMQIMSDELSKMYADGSMYRKEYDRLEKASENCLSKEEYIKERTKPLDF